MTPAKKKPPRHAITLTEIIKQQQELLIAAVTRQARQGQNSMEIGESAKGEPYVKSIQVYQADDEGWARMVERAVGMLEYAREKMPPPRENGAKP